jgi:hypothetical protein
MYTATFRRQEAIWSREDFAAVKYKADRKRKGNESRQRKIEKTEHCNNRL